MSLDPRCVEILDAGSTESGHPFFVMELVNGITVTAYRDQHRLGLPERLSLFRQVCSAVRHALQKGIIHRDPKPTNILLESHDDRPVPKVIDFGLAKATSGLELTKKSLFTAFGSAAGTPRYMAPEQAKFNALDIDTRAERNKRRGVLGTVGGISLSPSLISRTSDYADRHIIHNERMPTDRVAVSLGSQ